MIFWNDQDKLLLLDGDSREAKLLRRLGTEYKVIFPSGEPLKQSLTDPGVKREPNI